MTDVLLLEQPAGGAFPIIGATAALDMIDLPQLVVTRPNDANAYLSGDVFGELVHLAGICGAGQVGTVDCLMSQYSTPAGTAMPSLFVVGFDEEPDTVLHDNDPFAGLSDHDVDHLVLFNSVTLAASATPALQANRRVQLGRTTLVGSGVWPLGDAWLYFVTNGAHNPVALAELKCWLQARRG